MENLVYRIQNPDRNSKKDVYNNILAKNITDRRLIDFNYNKILELTDNSSDPIVEFLPNLKYNAHVLLCDKGLISYCPEKLEFFSENTLILANGYFNEIPIIFDRIHKRGLSNITNFEFCLGVCGRYNDRNVIDDINKYKRLIELLDQAYKIRIGEGLCIEETTLNDGIKIYTLDYHFYNPFSEMRGKRC